MTEFSRSARSAAVAVAVLLLALAPARFSVAMRVRGGSMFERLSRAMAGVVLDAAQVGWLVLAAVLLVVLLGLAVRVSRGFFARVGPVVAMAPFAAVLLVVSVTEQEVKAERGAFSTVAEMLDAAHEASFMEGAAGFLGFKRIFVPTLSMLVMLGLLLWRTRGGAKWHDPAASVRRHGLGVGLTFLLCAVALPMMASAQARLSARFSPASLGSPLESLTETTVDWLRGVPPARPLDLLSGLEPTPEQVALGERRLGWPRADDSVPERYRRPLDFEQESATPAKPLLEALARVSPKLFPAEGPPVAVFVFSLESFRGADLHALNPAAPVSLAPFVNGLAERPWPGVLFARHVFQGGVRTAQGLASLTCGLGTLPYNLSLIRDLGELPLRCAPDVLTEAGFHGRFVYASDPSYDQMEKFLRARGFSEVVGEAQFPEAAPRGAWGGVTDFVLVDEVVKRVAAELPKGPQLSLVMTLSNHSPYTRPQDLPEAVGARAMAALTSVPSRATVDDVKRLTTYTYTDAALERFFAALEREGLAERSIVLLLADHSTGDDYVWGADDVDHETDQAKANVPFAIVVPKAFVQRVGEAELAPALDAVQAELERTWLSLNDVPALWLALMSAHPGVKALPEARRWHTLGGQRTSPWFDAGVEGAALLGINGVDESYVLDGQGARLGSYEDAVFLRTKADRARVTPRLIPIAATLMSLSQKP